MDHPKWLWPRKTSCSVHTCFFRYINDMNCYNDRTADHFAKCQYWYEMANKDCLKSMATYADVPLSQADALHTTWKDLSASCLKQTKVCSCLMLPSSLDRKFEFCCNVSAHLHGTVKSAQLRSVTAGYLRDCLLPRGTRCIQGCACSESDDCNRALHRGLE
jgi:hypothetical protein